jgi:cysteine desulfurase
VIYLDNAASTSPAEEALAAMMDAARQLPANPASAHSLGAAAARALEVARAEVAAALDVEPAQILFTGGGTEADALGVLGAARAARGRHVVVSALEHPAVMRAAETLAGEGFAVDIVPPTPAGIVTADAVAAALRPDTALVAVMLAQNELGTLQPVAEIARRLEALGPRRPHFHVDAVQAFGLLRLRPRVLGADTIALSAHKLHGPRGAGALWARPGVRLRPLWVGGGQERGLRGGTENVPALVGFGRAAVLARQALADGAAEIVAGRRDRLEREALAAVARVIPDARPTVTGAPRVPHIASLAFPGVPAEPLLHALEARGVFASAGSACASKTAGPSPTLKAIGVDDRTAVLRFSLCRDTTDADVDGAVRALAEAVAEIAPLANGGARR